MVLMPKKKNLVPGDDPWERLKNLLILALALIFSSAYFLIILVGGGIVLILVFLLFLFRLLGFV